MHFEKVFLCRFLNLHQLKTIALNLTNLAVCFFFLSFVPVSSHIGSFNFIDKEIIFS